VSPRLLLGELASQQRLDAARVRTSAFPENDHNVRQAGKARAWRAWTGLTRIASYRLPDKQLRELSGAARELLLPVGLTLTAAIAHPA
jgi:hypothetical protein